MRDTPTAHSAQEKLQPMHRMFVTQGKLNFAFANAGAVRHWDVYLQIGQMSFFVPESVESYFRYLRKGIQVEGAQLPFAVVSMEVPHLDCGKLQDLSGWEAERPNVALRKAFAWGCSCGGKNLRVTDGLGFVLASVSLYEAG